MPNILSLTCILYFQSSHGYYVCYTSILFSILAFVWQAAVSFR